MKWMITIFLFITIGLPIGSAQNTWNKKFRVLSSYGNQTWGIETKGDKLYAQVVGRCGQNKKCSVIVEMNTDGEILNTYTVDQGEYKFDFYNSMLIDGGRILNTATSDLVDSFYTGTITSFDLNTKEFVHKKLSNHKGLFASSIFKKWKGTSNYVVVGQFQNHPGDAADAWCGVTILDSMLNIVKDTILNSDFYNIIPTDMYQDSDTSFIYFAKGCKYGKCTWNEGTKLYSYRINNKAEIIDSTLIGKAIDISEAAGTWAFFEPVNSGSDYYVLSWQDSLPVKTNTYEPYICKLDKKGKQVWKTNFKIDYIYSLDKHMNSMISLKNGDYLVVGTNLQSSWTSIGKNAGWAARINPEGKILWERNYYNKYPDYLLPKVYPDQSLNDAIEDDNENIYLSGETLDTLSNTNPQQYHYYCWILKIGADGCLEPGCADSLIYVNTDEIINILPDQLTVFPNPASDYLTVVWKDFPESATQIIIMDMQGREIKDLPTAGNFGDEQIQVRDMAPGMYLVSIKGNIWQSKPVKFIKN